MRGVERESELGWIDRIRRMAGAPRGSGVVLGIGDDCAIFRQRGATEDLVFTTDMLIEDVHFRRETHRPEDAGWKALARGLSDIAAMGAAPRFCLVSLALAPWADSKWVDGFYRGLLRLARREKTVLAGGDLGRAAKVMCDIVVCGSVPRGKALAPRRRPRGRWHLRQRRAGRLGAGLKPIGFQRKGAAKARRRHLKPEPRIALGRFLRERCAPPPPWTSATGCRSTCTALSRIRLERGYRCAAGLSGRVARTGAHGGEDYELLFTAGARTKVPGSFEGLPLTRIGTMRKGRPGAVSFSKDAPLPPLGYDHFRKP
jgi:thiamine-monophosphate kinase